MPTITATQVLTDFFQALNIYQPGDTFNANDTTTVLRQLNLMIGQWAQENLTIPAETRLVCPLQSVQTITNQQQQVQQQVVQIVTPPPPPLPPGVTVIQGGLTTNGNTGSSTAPFTVGPNGDVNIPTLPNQGSVTGAGLLLNASNPPVEIPRGVLTNEGYDAIQIKDLTSTLFTDIFYLPTYGSGLGLLFLWPVPTDLTNSLVLYLRLPLVQFADLTTQYNIPQGYDEALYLNLIVRAGKFFGRKADADDRLDARQSLATIKRSNVQLSDLQNDFATLGTNRGRRGIYNLQTGD